MKKRNKLPHILLIFVFLAGCVTADQKKEMGVEKSDISEVRAMLSQVEEFNKNAVTSYYLSFEVDGVVKKKKFKSLGRATYDRSKARMYISFLDYIFKSPITRVYISGKEIFFYFPVDKRLVKDNAATINLKNYNDVDIDYSIVYSLLTGTIPLISGYKVKIGLSRTKGDKTFLILENDTTYQTISFENNIPDRIKLLRKKNRRVTEIYLERPVQRNKSYFFRRIVMLEKGSGVRISLTFKSVNLNMPVKVKSINDLRLPRDARIVTM